MPVPGESFLYPRARRPSLAVYAVPYKIMDHNRAILGVLQGTRAVTFTLYRIKAVAGSSSNNCMSGFDVFSSCMLPITRSTYSTATPRTRRRRRRRSNARPFHRKQQKYCSHCCLRDLGFPSDTHSRAAGVRTVWCLKTAHLQTHRRHLYQSRAYTNLR